VKLVATAGKYAIVKSIINGRVRTEPDHPHGYVVLLDRLKPNAAGEVRRNAVTSTGLLAVSGGDK